MVRRMTGNTHGRPTAAELVAAVAEFLQSDVRQATDGQVNFHARVAGNVLRIVERELLQADSADVDGALATLAGGDEAELASAIREGRFDDRADDVMPLLRTLVGDRLAVAHPGYAVSAIADRLFAAIEAGDVDAVAQMWSNDVTVWQLGGRRPREKARALKVIDWFVSATSERHYDVIARQVFDGGFVQQHVLHGTNRDSAPYSMRVAMVVLVGADGLITRIDEYLDPAALEPLLNQAALPQRR
jgi:ketosteroid isomerase-like protein